MSKQTTKQEAPQAPAVEQEAPATAPESVQEAPQEAPQQEQANVTVEALAERLSVSQKDLRRWIRAQAHAAAKANGEANASGILPGKGGRYAFTEAQAALIVGAYASRKAARGTNAPGALLASFLAPAQAPQAPEQEAPQA